MADIAVDQIFLMSAMGEGHPSVTAGIDIDLFGPLIYSGAQNKSRGEDEHCNGSNLKIHQYASSIFRSSLVVLW